MPSCESVLSSFSATTSFHGVPHIASSRSRYWRCFWTLVCFLCLALFIYQLVPTIQRYYRYDKVMEIRINFERIPFPAVTVCNLNPYKKSAVQDNAKILELMETYEQAQTHLSHPGETRSKRSTVARRYTYFHIWCTCNPSHVDTSCESVPIDKVSIDEPSLANDESSTSRNESRAGSNDTAERATFNFGTLPKNELKMCICVQDTLSVKVYPCFPKIDWTQMVCRQCYATSGMCDYPSPDSATSKISKKSYPCTCTDRMDLCLFNHGVRIEEAETWKPTLYPPTEREIRWKKMEKYGYDKMEDKSSIQSRAVQNLIMITSEEPTEVRENMSYTREESIRSCSYGGSDCNITRDFTLHTDPGYGNCYTFNKEAYFQAARPGAIFGLRVFLYTDKSEYLPTTESMGVKVSIHDHAEYPFPDTFGYNAPVGFLSSFAVQAQKIEALPHPYGDCINLKSYNFTKEGYLYGTKYNIEATLCPPDNPKCIEDYREQGSFVEVYFQQVNYQLLREHEAYGWVNLMSDFGGQISLFLGASVITSVEVTVFLVRLFFSVFFCKKRCSDLADRERDTESVNHTYFVNGDSYGLRSSSQPYWEGD